MYIERERERGEGIKDVVPILRCSGKSNNLAHTCAKRTVQKLIHFITQGLLKKVDA